MLGRLPWQADQRGEPYQDPQGRFSIRIDWAWERVETGGRYTQFRMAAWPVDVYMLVVEAESVQVPGQACMCQSFPNAGR